MIRLALFLSTLALLIPGSAIAAEAPVAAAKTCHLITSEEFHSGATYLLKLRVAGITCPAGLKVEKAFQACRRATAGHMTCKKRVSGYKCTQKVLDQAKTQYDASVSCSARSRSVNFTYTQNR